MRACVQQLAPDDEVRKQMWFVGIKHGSKTNASQAERARHAVQQRRGSKEQVQVTPELIDELVGKISRSTYASGSTALQAGADQDAVWKLTGWVWAVLDEVLPA
jgi:hypothetical protein